MTTSNTSPNSPSAPSGTSGPSGPAGATSSAGDGTGVGAGVDVGIGTSTNMSTGTELAADGTGVGMGVGAGGSAEPVTSAGTGVGTRSDIHPADLRPADTSWSELDSPGNGLDSPSNNLGTSGKSAGGRMIDPRGPRFAATITTVVLVAILLTRSGWLAVAQAVVFAIGAGAGLRYAPYGAIYRTFVQKRLPKPKELEHEAPPRFAQAVGFVFIAAASIAFLAGATTVGIIATAFALAAAFLNAAFNYCLGCEMYLILRRATSH